MTAQLLRAATTYTAGKSSDISAVVIDYEASYRGVLKALNALGRQWDEADAALGLIEREPLTDDEFHAMRMARIRALTAVHP